uniref:ATP-dependent Clp protease proteolytic subunit n=1 Tax=Quercus lobata TaxID=97700 RepID=A0A7N2N9K3_QUELO
MMKLRETITRVYVQRTGTPLWVVSEDMERDVFMSATEAQAHGIVDHDRSKPAHYVYESTCQLLNNLLERRDSQSEMLRNPPPLGDALSDEEHVLGCMCDSFRAWTGAKEKNPFFQYQ